MTEMPLRVKNSPQTTGLNNQRGQATIEYVLLLFISVALVLMLIYQIFTPMQAFVQSFMGDYVACLLETGALPTLSGTDTKAADMGCGAQFAGGKYAGGSASGTNGGSGGNNGNNSSNSKNSSSSSNSSGNSGANSSGSSGYAGSASRGPGSSSSRGRDGPGSGSKAAPTVANNEFVEGSGFAKGGAGNGWSSSRSGRRVASIEYITLSAEDKKKVDEKKDKSSSAIVVEDGFASPTKKLSLKMPEAKTEIAPDDEPFTVGSFIRIIFIACIILAILVFVGGQALQMSKSSEK